MKTIYSFDLSTGIYLGPFDLNESDRSPLEPDVWHIPGFCTEVPPPDAPDGQAAYWRAGEWALVDLPKPPEPAPEVPKTTEQLNEEVRQQRAAAYREEADPLFFKWQRDEATKEEWLASIEAIKTRLPKIE